MKAITGALSAPLKLIGLVPKYPKLPKPTPVAQRDDAEAAMAQEDELARRRGGAADVITGAGGAEAAAGGKSLLGQ